MGQQSRLNPRAQQMAAAAPRVRDAVGHVLEIGDEVLVINPTTRWRVAQITPILDPGLDNQMKLLLVARVQIMVPRDSAVEDLYQLRHQAEIGDNLFKTDGDPGQTRDETT